MSLVNPENARLKGKIVHLHCDASEKEEIELEEANHDLVPLVHD